MVGGTYWRIGDPPISTKLGALYFCVKEIQIFINIQPFNSEKGDIDFFLLMLWHNRCFVQMCLLIGTVSQMSDVAHGPLISDILIENMNVC